MISAVLQAGGCDNWLLPSGGADACSSGADDLGPEFNGRTYRLKFMRGGRVIWVDVNPATGRILRRSRP